MLLTETKEDMMRLITLASGSRGNSTLVEGEHTKILIDAGISASEIEKRLRMVGTQPRDIDAILITHEHCDHIRGLKNFAKKYRTKIFVHSSIYEFMKTSLFGIDDSRILQFDERDFFLGEFTITPFEVSHDATHTNGFSLIQGGRKVSIVTDIGHISDRNLSCMLYSDLVVLESNHDEDLLMTGPYSSTLKRRIRSRNGHLSNQACAEAICFLAENGTKNFVLAHISDKNNTEELAKLACFDILEARKLSGDVHISIAYQDKVGTNYIIKNRENGEY